MIPLPLLFYAALVPVFAALAILLLARLYLRKFVPCKTDQRLDGKTVVITGGNCGVGQAISIDLSKRGARVVLACRDRGRRDSAPFSIRSRSGNTNVRFMYLDLSSLDSIVEFCHQFCESESRLDILINNAAVLTPRDWTVDGLDQTMGVNYFGHFLLTNLLLDKMRSTGSSTRVLNLVCDAYHLGKLDLDNESLLPFDEKDYDMYKAYGCSKLALLIMTKEMAIRFKKDGISFLSVNPGMVDTKILRKWPGKFGEIYRFLAKIAYLNCEEGAQSAIHAALSRDLEVDTGKCFYLGKASEPSVYYRTDALFSQHLWEKTEALLAAKGFQLVLKDDDDDE